MTDSFTGELTREQVCLAYRMILGREPESQDIISTQLDRHRDVASLRIAFLNSDEFRFSLGDVERPMMTEISDGYWSLANKVDYNVSPAVARQLAARTREQWTNLGTADPYWSVLSDERFRTDAIDKESIAEFNETGRSWAGLIDLTAARTGRAPPRGLCIELGCGVGRITRFLAERFDRIIAIDISPGNLALCDRYLASEGITNVETMLVTDLEDFTQLPEYDFFYSMIVLQHNSPPVQFRILQTLLSKLRSGGQCLFQTVADQPGYRFDVKDYLRSTPPEMEMHMLPMAAITQLMRDTGVQLDIARLDAFVGYYGSYSFAGHVD